MHISNLCGKKIILGVSGGIACYKALYLARELIKNNCFVEVIMTPNACKFITPLSFKAITNNHVWIEEWDSSASNNMAHINLSRKCDAIILAPATANTIAKLANGIADNLLCSTILAAPSNLPICICPAMNVNMWNNPATMRNINLLQQYNYHVIEPQCGEQACGECGIGRLSDLEEIIQTLEYILSPKTLVDKNILITLGATTEFIDPVRYITNLSSGKMGIAIAHSAYNLGAKVEVIMGNIDSNLKLNKNIKITKIQTAQQMYQAVNAYYLNNMQQNINKTNDIFIAVAAVADWMVETIAEHKIKKHSAENELNIKLKKTPDILQYVANLEQAPFCVGFCAESENLIINAQKKLIDKNLDLIIANLIQDSFAKDINTINIIKSKNKQNNEFLITEYTQKSKTELANIILKHLFR